MRLSTARDLFVIVLVVLGMLLGAFWFVERRAAVRRTEEMKILLEQQLHDKAREQQQELHGILKSLLEEMLKAKKAEAEESLAGSSP